VRLQRDGATAEARWRMRQPLPTWRAFEHERELLRVLGLARAALPVEIYTNGPSHVFVAVADERELAALDPDSGALAALGEIGVSCCCGAGRSWRARVFAPGLGVAEDPATGSAAGPLAVHLARHGASQLGAEIEITQGVEIGRPSLLLALADGEGERIERVEVAGSAVLVAGGAFAASAL
jgi:trans-2,3-dihydro-3-hydroxyanthranilate isomerase